MSLWHEIKRQEEGQEVKNCPECGIKFYPDHEEGVTETCYKCYGIWLAELNYKIESGD
tara:strand:+ start:173 stop:346 length:174 start_codon:yes stop_codon:yes gene_type:complete